MSNLFYTGQTVFNRPINYQTTSNLPYHQQAPWTVTGLKDIVKRRATMTANRVPRLMNGTGEIGCFLNTHGASQEFSNIVVTPALSKKPINAIRGIQSKKVQLPSGDYKLHQKGNSYYLWTKKIDGSRGIPLKIKAKNDKDFSNQLKSILSETTARGKLTAHARRLINTAPDNPRYVVKFNPDMLLQDGSDYVFLNQNQQNYLEAFDSKSGNLNQTQLNEYFPSLGNTYSEDEKINIKDGVYKKFRAFDNILDIDPSTAELLSNIIKQSYPDQKLHAGDVALMVNRIRLSFRRFPIDDQYNDYHNGAKNNWTGNRRWKKMAPVTLKGMLLKFYTGSPTGDAKFKYDSNPEGFKAFIKDCFKIEPSDKQYLEQWASKSLAAKVGIHIIQDEIRKVKLDDNLPPEQRAKNQKKIADLYELHDFFMEQLGENKNTLRHVNVGWGSYADMLEKQPNVILRDGVTTHIDENNFKKAAKDGFYDLVNKFMPMQNAYGANIRIGLANDIKQSIGNLFSTPVPETTLQHTTGLIMQSLDKTSRTIRDLTDFTGEISNIKNNLRLTTKRQLEGDNKGRSMLLEQLKGNTYDTSFEQNIKGGFLKRFLQIHGYVLDAEPFTPPRQKGYDNMIGGEMNDTESGSLLHKLDGVGKMFNGSIFGALRANYASNKFGTKLEDFLKQAATLVHNHSQSLRGQNVPNGLKTNKIVEAEKLVRAAAQEMALDYMSEHYYLFNHPKNKNDEITKHFFNKVQDEFKNLLQTTVNAVALAAYKKPEPAYLPPI